MAFHDDYDSYISNTTYKIVNGMKAMRSYTIQLLETTASDVLRPPLCRFTVGQRACGPTPWETIGKMDGKWGTCGVKNDPLGCLMGFNGI